MRLRNSILAGVEGTFIMDKAKWIVVCVVTGLLAILLLQNRDPVTTKIFFSTVVMPRAFLLLATALLGFLCGVALTLLLVVKRASGREKKNEKDR
jgi:uncharacterized integral membrane protein